MPNPFIPEFGAASDRGAVLLVCVAGAGECGGDVVQALNGLEHRCDCTVPASSIGGQAQGSFCRAGRADLMNQVCGYCLIRKA